MNVCDNLGDHLVGNVYVRVSKPLMSILWLSVALSDCSLYVGCLLVMGETYGSCGENMLVMGKTYASYGENIS